MVANSGSPLQVEPKLCVGVVIHKAVIEVDEKGTEAAAATAVAMVMCCSNVLPPPDIIVTLNRPFAFWLSTEDDVTLFAGVCSEP